MRLTIVNTLCYCCHQTKDASSYYRWGLRNAYMQASVLMELLEASYCSTGKHDTSSPYSAWGVFGLKLYAPNETVSTFCNMVIFNLFHKHTQSQSYPISKHTKQLLGSSFRIKKKSYSHSILRLLPSWPKIHKHGHNPRTFYFMFFQHPNQWTSCSQ